MDQTNLDAMFEDMLGELDIISQQLEEKSDKTEAPDSAKNRASSSSHSSTAEQEEDFDLNAMLNDLTDWEQTLSPAPQVLVTQEVGGDERHDIVGTDNLPQNSNKLARGLDASPQFNTLKRSMTDGPSVTFGDDEELSLASLEKDIESENRKRDKARQLSAEELAALSPVMQELDDLVSDLSKMSFKNGLEEKRFLKYAGERLNMNGSSLEKCPSKSTTSQNAVSRKSSEFGSKAFETTDQQQCILSCNERNTLESGLKSGKSVVSQSKHSSNTVEGSHLSNAPSPSKKSMVLSATKLFGNEPKEQVSESAKTTNFTGANITPPRTVSDPSVTHLFPKKLKPPLPPPLATKPKLPEKPQLAAFHNQHSISAPSPNTQRPTMFVKRQSSIKAPANLANILERQLLQHGVSGEQRNPDSSQGVTKSTSPLRADHDELQKGKNLALRQNSFDAKSFASDAQLLGTAHPTSLASVESNLSTTSSVASFKSTSSADSTSSEYSRHSADYTNDKVVPEDIKAFLSVIPKQSELESTPEVREERMRAEKMRIALEKLKEARIQKLVVKVFNKDDSSKTLMVDERMTTRSIVKQLLEKNHYEPSVNWALVEELPSLYMERIFEEHESVTEMLSYWTRDTTNQVRFLERKDKYALFRNPQHYLLSVSDAENQMAERQKQTLIEEFFSGRSGSGVPEVQGILYIKGESKSWGRKYCVLRNSGLYCSKSGEPKKGKKVSDLQCLVMFEQVCVYLGRGWKKKHKSPTDYGFALKHPAIQTKSKHIRYFCSDDVRSLMRWIVGIRCAKYGKQLKDNFDRTNTEMKGFGDGPTVAYQTTQLDATSNDIGDSAESDKPTVPHSSITNVFGGAWQRANQQETSEGSEKSGSGVQRGKSVWNPGQPKTSSNWWDLGASPELEELAGSTQLHDPKILKTDLEAKDLQANDPSSEVAGHSAPAPGYHASQVPQPPPPFSKKPQSNVPRKPPTLATGVSAPTTMMPDVSGARRTVMPQKKMPPPPPGPKPMLKNVVGPPPPPPMSDLPPPPPLDDMPPPPPMDDLPPPPDDDMPLPPPMELSPSPGLPKGLQGVEGQPPIRLPFLPMFKNGSTVANLSHPSPGTRRGPPAGNFNSSNNKPSHTVSSPHSHARQKSHDGYRRHHHQHDKSPLQPPLTEYYTSKEVAGESTLYLKSALPPPPDFVHDLKDTFHHAMGRDSSVDLPPPPPELLLHEVRSRSCFGTSKTMKSAPPPPRRSPSTKLSFKNK